MNERQTRQCEVYEFTPTIDVLSDGSELTNVTLFLSIWRRRHRTQQQHQQQPDNNSNNSESNNNNQILTRDPNANTIEQSQHPKFVNGGNEDHEIGGITTNNTNDLGSLVRRYAMTGLTTALGRLAADQGYSLATVQVVVCPLLADRDETDDDDCTFRGGNESMASSYTNPSSTTASLEGLASLLLSLHQSGTLHQFTMILVPFGSSNVGKTENGSAAADALICPVEQIAKLILENKSTTSTCPIRTCHVPLKTTLSTTTTTTTSPHLQDECHQPWWLVHQDEFLYLHSKIIPITNKTTTSKKERNVFVTIFWYTLWCCCGGGDDDDEIANNKDHSSSVRRRAYNLGVAIMPQHVQFTSREIEDWFTLVPERNTPSSSTLSCSSLLDALVLVGSVEKESYSNHSSWGKLPLVLLANISSKIVPTANDTIAPNFPSTPSILFRKAHQQAIHLQNHFPRHIFVPSSVVSTCELQQLQNRAAAKSFSNTVSSMTSCQPSQSQSSRSTTFMTLVSGTSIELSSPGSGASGCRVLHRSSRGHATYITHQSNTPSTLHAEEIEQVLRLKVMQQSLQDYLDASSPVSAPCDSTHRGGSTSYGDVVPTRQNIVVSANADENEIDLDEDADEYRHKGRNNVLPANVHSNCHKATPNNTTLNGVVNHHQDVTVNVSNESAPPNFFFHRAPHLLVLGTGCASPSALRGSSAYGILLPHFVPPLSRRSDADAPHGDHLVLTAILECGEDIVSQLYRFLPPPPQRGAFIRPTSTAPVDRDAWFHYQLRQIRFIWISHAHLDHYGGLPTLLRHIHRAHQHHFKHLPSTQRHLHHRDAKRLKQEHDNESKRRLPLVIAPPRVLAYLKALDLPMEMYQAVTQVEYDKNTIWQQWISEITLTSSVSIPKRCLNTGQVTGNNMHDSQNNAVIGRDYHPFQFLRNVPVDHDCAHAYGLFLGFAPCLWYSESEKNLPPPPPNNNHHPRFGHPFARVLCFSGDTRPCSRLVKQLPLTPHISNRFLFQPVVDWLIHEATFDPKEEKLAQSKAHSTSLQALRIAEQLNAKLCLLTHFSQRYRHAMPYAFPSSSIIDDDFKGDISNNGKEVASIRPKVLFAFDGLFLPLLL